MIVGGGGGNVDNRGISSIRVFRVQPIRVHINLVIRVVILAFSLFQSDFPAILVFHSSNWCIGMSVITGKSKFHKTNDIKTHFVQPNSYSALLLPKCLRLRKWLITSTPIKR